MAALEEKEFGILTRIVNLLKQSPYIAFCIWMGLREIQHENKFEEVTRRYEIRDSIRERDIQEQLKYYREDRQQELNEKIYQLMKKYEKDSL